MWTFEERTRLTHRRTEELRQREWGREQTFSDTAVTAVCLILAVGVSLSIAEMTKTISTAGIPHTFSAASIIGNQAWLGYIIAGTFSLSLDVSSTTLLCRLHLRNKRKRQNNTKSTK